MMKFKEWFADKYGFCPDRWAWAPGERFEDSLARLMDGVAEYIGEAVVDLRADAARSMFKPRKEG